jgi:hypothetical protein
MDVRVIRCGKLIVLSDGNCTWTRQNVKFITDDNISWSCIEADGLWRARRNGPVARQHAQYLQEFLDYNPSRDPRVGPDSGFYTAEAWAARGFQSAFERSRHR